MESTVLIMSKSSVLWIWGLGGGYGERAWAVIGTRSAVPLNLVGQSYF